MRICRNLTPGRPAEERAIDTVGEVERRTQLLLVPLRLFLGITFLYAGLQKFADPNFLSSSAPASIHAQLTTAAHGTPLASLARALAPHAALVGLLIAAGEVAVGLGVIAGLLTPFAAAGGLLLSAGFWLTVSWHTRPYYYGADLVFLMAWTPLLLAPTPLPFSLDGVVRRNTHGADDVDASRRAFLRKLSLAGTGLVAATFVEGTAAAIGRLRRPPGGPSAGQLAGGRSLTSPPTTPPTTPPSAASRQSTRPRQTQPPATNPPPPGILIGSAAGVPVGGAARFHDPLTGEPALVFQPRAGHFDARSAVCTHAGCTVQPAGGDVIACPCHGAEFSSSTGAVLRGPARRPLPAIPVTEGSDGNLYRLR